MEEHLAQCGLLLIQVPWLLLSGDFRQKERAMAMFALPNQEICIWAKNRHSSGFVHTSTNQITINNHYPGDFLITIYYQSGHGSPLISPGAEALFAILEDADADIICLQEVHRLGM